MFDTLVDDYSDDKNNVVDQCADEMGNNSSSNLND